MRATHIRQHIGKLIDRYNIFAKQRVGVPRIPAGGQRIIQPLRRMIVERCLPMHAGIPLTYGPCGAVHNQLARQPLPAHIGIHIQIIEQAFFDG